MPVNLKRLERIMHERYGSDEADSPAQVANMIKYALREATGPHKYKDKLWAVEGNWQAETRPHAELDNSAFDLRILGFFRKRADAMSAVEADVNRYKGRPPIVFNWQDKGEWPEPFLRWWAEWGEPCDDGYVIRCGARISLYPIDYLEH